MQKELEGLEAEREWKCQKSSVKLKMCQFCLKMRLKKGEKMINKSMNEQSIGKQRNYTYMDFDSRHACKTAAIG